MDITANAGSVITIKYNIFTNFNSGITAAGGNTPTFGLGTMSGATRTIMMEWREGPTTSARTLSYGSYTPSSGIPLRRRHSPASAGDPVSNDIDGNSRPLGEGWDMGCYEGESYNPKLIVDIYPEDTGSGRILAAGIDCPTGACKEFFDKDQTVTLTAAAVGGNRFDHWQDGIQGIDNPGSLIMGKNDVTVTAVFTPDSHTRGIPAGMTES